MKKKLQIAIAIMFLAGGLSLILPQKAAAFSGTGAGTVGDPYLIDTCEELQSIDEMGNTSRKVFQLSADIDCSATSGWNEGAGFNPINYFEGVFDGRGHTISGLIINRPSDDSVGLFAVINGGLVSSVSIDATSSITGESYVGSLVGNADYARIRDVQSGATVNGYNFVGGIIGRVYGSPDDMIVEKTYYYGDVTAVAWAGGIAGDAYYGHTFTDIRFAGTVTADGAGGIIGLVEQSCGARSINNALVEGSLSGISHVGGFVARYLNISCDSAQINNSVSYATLSGGATALGGIMGAQVNASNLITVNNVYFDHAAAGTSACVGIVDNSPITCGDTTGNAPPTGEPFAQWDFDNIWSQPDGVALRSPFPFLEGPDSIDDLTASQGMGAAYVDISWSPPASTGTYDIDGYRIEIKEQGDDWTSLFDSTNQDNTSTGFSNLRLGKTYVIRVQALTVYGGSDWVETTYTTPDPEVFDIGTCAQLQAISETGSNLDTYRLTADIDCSGVENFQPIGWVEQDFGGVFDGQGYTISNVAMTGDDNYTFGLFSYADGAIFRNVNLADGSISVTNDGGECGALLGDGENIEITNVVVRSYNIDCTYYAGGLIGIVDSNYGDGIVIDNVSVEGGMIAGQDSIGGLIGEVDVDDATNMSIEQSFTATSVSASSYSAGGLIGGAYVENDDDDGDPDAVLSLRDVYSQSDVEGEYQVGGIIGYTELYTDGYETVAKLEIENVYSSGSLAAVSEVGGLIGDLYDLDYEGDQVVINNSFTASSINYEDADEVHAIIGGSYFLDDGSLTMDGVYFDQTATGQSQAIYEDDYAGSFAVNTDGSQNDYFLGNSDNPPLDQWDFDDVWQLNDGALPTFTPYQAPDSDNDGIADNIEAAGPNGGDVNNDGIADSEQANVTAFVNSITGAYMAIVTECDANYNVQNGAESAEQSDAGYNYPVGLVAFVGQSCGTPGSTVQVNIYYYGNYDASSLTLRKSAGGSYYTIDTAVLENITIDNSPVLHVSYAVVDGGVLDLDGEADGNIVDPVGAGALAVGSPNTGLKPASN